MKPDQIAELYHLHHIQYTEDLPFWLGLAQQSGGPVLELGCGTGRVLLALAETGIDVTGVDNDTAMLSVLRRQLAARPRQNVTVIEDDFMKMSPPEKYPLVILPCNTYSTLDPESRAALLDRLPGWLTPEGLFAVSLPNPALLASLEPESEPELELALDLPDQDATLAISSGWAREGDWLRFDWVYDLMHEDGRVERGGASTRHLLTPWEALAKEFRAAGFELEAWGDYAGTAFDEDQAANLIVIAQRG